MQEKMIKLIEEASEIISNYSNSISKEDAKEYFIKKYIKEENYE